MFRSTMHKSLTLIAFLALVATPFAAQAGGGGGGGGGTKQNGQIIVRNTTGNTLIVRIDQNAAAAFPGEGEVIDDAAIDAFEATGGRQVGPNGSTTFRSLRNGNFVISASFVDETDPVNPLTGTAATRTVRVKNNTITVRLAGDSTGATSTVTPASAAVP
jgi:hypothetical protein